MSTWLSLLPALVAIPVAMITHRVLLALGLYIFLGALILEGGWLPDASARVVETVWQVATDRDNVFIIVFSLLIGGLIGLIQRSGGIQGFIHWAEDRWLNGDPRKVSGLAFFTSMALFIETYFGVLVAGLVALPLFDRYKLPRLRLSYILDTTCSPKCMLIPINAWGAYIITLLADEGVESPAWVLVKSLGFIFYGWVAIALVAVVALTGRELPWKLPVSEKVVGDLPHFGTAIEPYPRSPAHPRYLWWPIAGLVATALILLLVSGDAPLAIFTAVLVTLIATVIYFRREDVLPWNEMLAPVCEGVQVILPLMYLLIFAFSVGATTHALGTGEYLATALRGELDPLWLPFLVFGIGCLISFSTGTSWGTFAILIPTVVPMAEAFDVSTALLVGAALSGGLFGDHCSPVSDTTMIASLAAGVKPIEHIRHQFPYALLGAGVALVLYLIVGAAMV